jgi:hypothetical protein
MLPEKADSQVDPVEGVNVPLVQSVIAKYLYHVRSITVIRQLISLITVAQQHRGTNLALLEGDRSFADKAADLQTEIDYRLATLQILNQELSTPILPQIIKTLLQEWETVRNWSGAAALENFNLHSNFIEKQMELMSSLAEKTHGFALAYSSGPSSQSDSSSSDTMLVEFILVETPEFMELLARMRGLATHACVIGACDSEHTALLDYLLKQLNLKKERFRVLSKLLQKYSLHDVPALVDLQIQDVRIVQLIQLVENKILHQDKIELDSHLIFRMATNIVNSQKEVVRQGLDFIQNKIHRQLADWYDGVGEQNPGIE